MPTLSVNWNYKTYRVTVTPSTILGDVLKESCQHFNLGSDFTLYKLVNRNGKEIDLGLPFRFSNLAQGANLDIVGPPAGVVQTGKKEDGESGQAIKSSGDNEGNCDNQKYVNLRISVSTPENTTTTVTDKFANDISLNGVLERLAEKRYLDQVSHSRVAIQIMMRVLDAGEYDKSLASLGLVEGNHAIRLRVKPIDHAIVKSRPTEEKKVTEEKPKDTTKTEKATVPAVLVSDKQAEVNAAESTKQEQPKEQSIVSEPEKIRTTDVRAEPPKNDIDIKYVHHGNGRNAARENDHDDSSYEMSIEQARIYQRLLSKQAADQPMLTKALREKLEEEERQRKEQVKQSNYTGESIIRIKFPDNKVVQVKIDNRKTLKDLAEVLVEKVLKPEIVPRKYKSGDDLFFELYVAHPYSKILGQNTELAKTIDDCEFGNRISLLFRFEPEYTMALVPNGYILDHLLEKLDDTASPTGPASAEANQTNSSTTSTEEKPHQPAEGLNGTKRAKFKQVPAWMKLSKKV